MQVPDSEQARLTALRLSRFALAIAIGLLGSLTAAPLSAGQAGAPPAAQQPAPLPTTSLPPPPEVQPGIPLPTLSPAAEPPKPAIYGLDIFRQDAGPITEGPIDEQFILSPGDEVVISVWGQLNLLYNLTVSEQGFIELPEEGGRIQTNGLSLKELKTKVTQALSAIHSSYIDAENPSASTAFVDVRLGKVRKLLLYVIGEVHKPGAYTLSSGTATVINLLYGAGGITPAGSLREVRVRRVNGRVDTIDLYEFLAGQLSPQKLQLLSGDYVIVPLRKKAVTVMGEVRRPMTYELLPNEGLKQLVGLAGGFLPDAYLIRSQLKRFVVNLGEVYQDLDLERIYADARANYDLQDGDELTVMRNIQVRKSVVTINGEGILRPGNYQFKPGMTLNDLIQNAGGLREYALLDRADLIRTQDDFSKMLAPFDLRELYREVRPGVLTFSNNTAKNFPLKEMDQVTVYSRFAMAGQDKFVSLEGEVREPGRALLTKNMTLYDLLFARGGFQDPEMRRKAYLDLGHIVRKVPGALGTRLIPFDPGDVIAGDEAANQTLEEEDVVRIYSNEQMRTPARVTIGGLVNRPGTYDVSENLTVEDLIVLAGGLRQDAYKVEAAIARSEGLSGDGVEPAPSGTANTRATLRESTIRVEIARDYARLPQNVKTPLRPFDRVMIRNLPGFEPMEVVSLSGEVPFPGQYTLQSRVDRISSVITRAGGLRREALPEGAIVRRQRVGQDRAPDEPAVYEITLNLREALDHPGGDYDLILKGGDSIYIPSNPGTVEVRGAVGRPLVLQYNPALSLLDYIELCGGMLESANRDEVIVYSANNSAMKVPLRERGFLFWKRTDLPPVRPGSTIEVPFVAQATRLETVEVRGAVARPAVLQYIKGATLGYYLDLTGGFSQAADIDGVVVHLPSGELLSGGRTFNPVIPTGAVIVVTAKAGGEAR